jgi:hypothetical protein
MNYKKIYNELCSRAKSENRIKNKGTYYEAHHIIPKSHGGDGLVGQYKWHPNVVLLTAREHFVAHKLLLKIYPDSKKLKFAFNGMCNQNAPNQQRDYKVTSKDYELAKTLFIESFSGENHHLHGQGWKQAGEKNPAYGKPQSEELRARKRESAIKSWSNPELIEAQRKRSMGRKDSEETRLKKKQPKSEEHKKRIGESLKGKKRTIESTTQMMIGRYGIDWYNKNYPNGYDGVNKKKKQQQQYE